MKKIQLHSYVILFWLLSITIMAQPVSKRDKIEALRVSFINQKVSFTPTEAQAFWPLYNEYNDKVELNRKTFRQQFKNNATILITMFLLLKTIL